ncbi:MAG TPA: lipid II flippase MurJ [Candidatus Paceibacterota bacterium]|nr:lipid II flippase MurJ [Candidatus Paceibacterota bacterium]
MNQAALVLAVFSFLSQVFGLLRDHLLASLVGPGTSLDTYYAAFRIPDLVYNSFGMFFSVTVLIPFIAQYVEQEKIDGHNGAMKRFLNSIFSVFMIGMVALSLILIILMPWLTRVIAPGFNGAEHMHLVFYSRIMLISPLLFGLASLLSSFSQVQKKFFAFAIAPVMYNFGILLGIVALRPIFGITGVVFGVVIGAILYFGVQVPTLIKLGKIPKFTFGIDWPTIKRVILLSLPRTLSSSLNYITFIIIGAFASLLAAGSISIFQFSYNIENTPLLIIGVSYAVAAFPAMTKVYAAGDKKELMNILYRTTRNIFFLCIPVSLLMIILRAHIVRLLLGAGVFSWNDTRLVAAAVALFALSIVAQSLELLLIRAFFAIGDTKTPLIINSWSTVLTIGSAVGLVFFYHYNFFFNAFINSLMRIDGTVGASVILLPLGFSIGESINAWALWVAFKKKLQVSKSEDRTFTRNIMYMIEASILAAAAAYGMLMVTGGNTVVQTRFFGVLLQAVIATAVGAAVYGIVLKALRNEDLALFMETAKSRFWKQKPVVVQEQQEL